MARIETPLGYMYATQEEGKLLSLSFQPREDKSPNNPVFLQLQTQLDEYFNGTRKNFDIPLAPKGTVFQELVWESLLQIPHGETCSYKKQAIMLGRPTAFRAVANANSKNPIAILIPCHRVIKANGDLCGYNGGVEIKRKLLELEA